jgi:hypothetical protein
MAELTTYYATMSDNQSFNGKYGPGYVEIHAENIEGVQDARRPPRTVA